MSRGTTYLQLCMSTFNLMQIYRPRVIIYLFFKLNISKSNLIYSFFQTYKR